MDNLPCSFEGEGVEDSKGDWPLMLAVVGCLINLRE